MTYCTDRFTRLDYCQFLVSSPLNYSIPHFADHAKKWSHDTINRYLRGETIPPRFLWDQVKNQVVCSEEGYLLFDDTVLDKNHSRKIETVRRQWSGNEKRVIRGIGVVTCVYVNPKTEQFWSIDYRIYDPETDSKTKIDHLRDMLTNVRYQKKLPFQAVLMDSWYASREVMRHVEKLDKVYFCPIKTNRRGDETEGGRDGGGTRRRGDETEGGRDGGNRAALPRRGPRVERGRREVRQDHPFENLSEGPSREAVPACGFSQPHGLHHHEPA